MLMKYYLFVRFPKYTKGMQIILCFRCCCGGSYACTWHFITHCFL